MMATFGGSNMDIAGISLAMSQAKLLTEVKTAMLAKSLDAQDQTKNAIKMMMEQSVNPNLGQNIDISV